MTEDELEELVGDGMMVRKLPVDIEGLTFFGTIPAGVLEESWTVNVVRDDDRTFVEDTNGELIRICRSLDVFERDELPEETLIRAVVYLVTVAAEVVGLAPGPTNLEKVDARHSDVSVQAPSLERTESEIVFHFDMERWNFPRDNSWIQRYAVMLTSDYELEVEKENFPMV